MTEITNGVDMVEIARIKRVMSSPRFYQRFFSEDEVALFAAKNHAPQTVAANFAAKEAFAKAIGTGIREFSLRDISVLRDYYGAPYFAFSGAAAQLVELYGYQFSLSVSHSRTYAIAMVVAYR